MSAIPDETSADVVRSYFERWKRLEEEKATVAADLKELFAEAKSNGFDTKAMRAAFRLQVAERTPDDDEFDALVEMFTAVLNGPRARPADARSTHYANDEAA